MANSLIGVLRMSVQYSRRPFTVAEYDQMVETGILREDDWVELIGRSTFAGAVGYRLNDYPSSFIIYRSSFPTAGNS